MTLLVKAQRIRSRAAAHRLIALSLSYERAPLLARGFGLEHLRELLVLLARPLLRQGASLAYGGRLQERNDNFTFDLLRLVSAEQDEAAQEGTHVDLERFVRRRPGRGRNQPAGQHQAADHHRDAGHTVQDRQNRRDLGAVDLQMGR